MRLYHFTSRVHYHFIKTHGIDRGECPVALGKIFQHPNLTTDPTPHAQGWSDESGGAVRLTTNKKGVRVTVDVPDGDPALISWRKLTEEHKMDRATYRKYDASGNFGGKNWWIYRGTIPPEWFAAVDVYSTDETASPVELALMREARKYENYDAMMTGVGFFRHPQYGFMTIDPDKLERLAGLDLIGD